MAAPDILCLVSQQSLQKSVALKKRDARGQSPLPVTVKSAKVMVVSKRAIKVI